MLAIRLWQVAFHAKFSMVSHALSARLAYRRAFCRRPCLRRALARLDEAMKMMSGSGLFSRISRRPFSASWIWPNESRAVLRLHVARWMRCWSFSSRANCSAASNCSAAWRKSPRRTCRVPSAVNSEYRASRSAAMEGSSIVFLDLLFSDLLFGLELELDEALDLFLRAGRQPLVLPQELVFAVARHRGRVFVEEIGDVHFEDRENLEQCLEANLVLPVLHAAEIGLLDADPMGQVRLCEAPILAERSDSGPDQQGLPFKF